MSVIKINKSSGFSLLELVTVLLIITVLSTIAIRSTVDIGYSVRFEQTRDRLESIRKAIVGDPTRSINGQPDISGFVADMGRLPINVRELLSPDAFCIDPDYSDDVSNESLYGTQALCTGAGYTWHAITPINMPQQQEGYLKSGWQGPYIQVSETPTSTTSDIYADGWGNKVNSETAFEHYFDYGWYWCHWDNADDGDGNNLPDDTDGTPDEFPNCNNISVGSLEHLSIYSLGRDGDGDVGVDGSVTCGGDEYNDDCYTTVVKDDYVVDISSGISITFIKSYSPAVIPSPATSLCTDPSITSKASCTSPNTWYGGCSNAGYLNNNSCTGTWINCSDGTSPDKTTCEAASEQWYGEGYGCSNQQGINKTSCLALPGPPIWRSCTDDGTISEQSICTINDEIWYGDSLYTIDLPPKSSSYNTKNICLNIFYRAAIDSTVRFTTSTPIMIEENGSYQTIHFTGFSVTEIPIGINAIGIYEYTDTDGDTVFCEPDNDARYPSDRMQAIQVMFKPHSSIPTINW